MCVFVRLHMDPGIIWWFFPHPFWKFYSRVQWHSPGSSNFIGLQAQTTDTWRLLIAGVELMAYGGGKWGWLPCPRHEYTIPVPSSFTVNNGVVLPLTSRELEAVSGGSGLIYGVGIHSDCVDVTHIRASYTFDGVKLLNFKCDIFGCFCQFLRI